MSNKPGKSNPSKKAKNEKHPHGAVASLHYLEVNAMLSRAQFCMSEAQGILAWHIGSRKALNDEDYERYLEWVIEVDAISEKLQEVDRSQVVVWPGWALELIDSKGESIQMAFEALNGLERHYHELFHTEDSED